MLHELSKNKGLKSQIKEFLKKYEEEVIDIVLFGSFAKGKEKPRDVDVLLILKKKEDLDIAYALRKSLEKIHLHITVTTKTYRSLFSEGFIAKEAYLSEGYSLLYDQFVSQGLGYTNIVLFKYELKGLTQSQRMQFHYSLHGRNNEPGMLKKLALTKFATGILLSPAAHAEKTKEYLSFWNIHFQEIPALIPSRIVD